jgi:hypothetical protein
MTEESEGLLDSAAAGALVQAYAYARFYGPRGEGGAEAHGESLDPILKERVDALGFDLKRLLDVPPEKVLARLVALEREAQLEDAGVRPQAAAARGREEQVFRGESRGEATVVRREQRPRSWRQR